MITFLGSFAAGNAVQVLLSPPNGARAWRLLRKETDDIASQADPAAKLLFDGTLRSYVDIGKIENGKRYFYRAFYFDGQSWVASATRSIVPEALFEDASTDVLSLLRDRIDLGLQTYVKRGAIKHRLGKVPVLTSSPLLDQVEMPMVTLHLVSDSPGERFVGEMIGEDTNDGEFVSSAEGWHSNTQISIICWTGSADVRLALRRALKSILLVNMPIFESQGVYKIDPSFADQEDFQNYDAPMFQSMCTFTCVAISAVESQARAIADVSAVSVFLQP